MPPRYAYWTIIAGGLPTAFRAAEKDELLPTFKRIQEKQPDAEMKFFARGKLWDTPEQALRAEAGPRGRGAEDARPPERRDRDWRPGGEHRDPRQPFKDAKKTRNQERRQERWDRKNAPPRERPHGDPIRQEVRPRKEWNDRPPRQDWRDRSPKQDWRDRPPRQDSDRGGGGAAGQGGYGAKGGNRGGGYAGRSGQGGAGRPFDTRGGGSPDKGNRGRWENRGGSFQDRNRGSFQDRNRGSFQDRNRGSFQDRNRGSFDDRNRGSFDDRNRGPSSDRNRGPSEGRNSSRPPRNKPFDAPQVRPHGDKLGDRPFRPRSERGQDPPPPPRPKGPNREPRRGQEPPPEPPPRPSEPTIMPPGPPERGRLVKKKRDRKDS